MASKITLAGGELPAGDEPPKEFRVWEFGTVETSKGDFLFDEESAKTLMADYKQHSGDHAQSICIDYEHMAVNPDARAGDGKAAGWCSLELRDDGLWATDVRWTPPAEAALKNKEYRYFSPAFEVDEDNRILTLTNIALTNIPATHKMAPLVAASKPAASTKPSTPGSARIVSKPKTKRSTSMADEPNTTDDTVSTDGEELSDEEMAKLEEDLKKAKRCKAKKMAEELKALQEELGEEDLDSDDDDSAKPADDDEPAKTSVAKKTSKSAIQTIQEALGVNSESAALGAIIALTETSKVQATAAHAAKVDGLIKACKLPPSLRKKALTWDGETLSAFVINFKGTIRTSETAHQESTVGASMTDQIENELQAVLSEDPNLTQTLTVPVGKSGQTVKLSAEQVKGLRNFWGHQFEEKVRSGAIGVLCSKKTSPRAMTLAQLRGE
jgi:phage I-like protein